MQKAQQLPFPHTVVSDFLKKEKYQSLKKALQTQPFTRKEADLFSFSQTHDLLGSQDKHIKEFISMLKDKTFVANVNKILFTKAKPGHVDAAGFLYEETDYLLPHNDGISSRKVAYIMYFNTLKKKNGGALALYATRNNEPTKVVKRILPKENTLLLFAVTPHSFHAVEEVLTKNKRYTIAGWLHD